jgi:hypothetical protein
MKNVSDFVNASQTDGVLRYLAKEFGLDTQDIKPGSLLARLWGGAGKQAQWTEFQKTISQNKDDLTKALSDYLKTSKDGFIVRDGITSYTASVIQSADPHGAIKGNVLIGNEKKEIYQSVLEIKPEKIP